MTWIDLIKKTVIRHVDAKLLDDIPKTIKHINQTADDDYKEFLGFPANRRAAILTLIRLICLLLPKEHEGVAVLPDVDGAYWFKMIGDYPSGKRLVNYYSKFEYDVADLGGKKYEDLSPSHQKKLNRWLGLVEGDIVPKRYMPHHRRLNRYWYRKKYWTDPSNKNGDKKRAVKI
jgi:hypothetical protein